MQMGLAIGIERSQNHILLQSTIHLDKKPKHFVL